MYKRGYSAFVAVLFAITLTGCSPTSEDSNCLKVESGSASNSIVVSGEFGESVSVVIGSADTVESLQRTVVIPGKGSISETGESVIANVTTFDAITGDRINEIQDEIIVGSPNIAAPVRAGVDCLAIGTRTVSIFPATKLYSEKLLTDIGLSSSQSLIQVIDVLDTKPASE